MSDFPDTIVLIHGLWMTPRSWEDWAGRYQGQGWNVLTPPWPGMEAEVEELNRDPSPIAALDIEQIVDHYDGIIRGLPCQPIIIGHGLGGAIVQVLLDRGLGAAGICIASASVKGVFDLPFTTIKATSPVPLNPFNRGKAIPLDEEQFHYAFTNTLDREESDAVYRRYHVPAAATVLFESAFANLHLHAPTRVNFYRSEHAPLLFFAFGEDHICPPDAVYHMSQRYGVRTHVNYKEFDGRPHFFGVSGWEEIADHALAWAAAYATMATLTVVA
jgi:pimeloyl-ACP methyl ester carboxylesterase